MKNMKSILLTAAAVLIITGCGLADDNAKPIYGKESGLPANCRAYVQVVVDSYRARKYSADESMNALERNCGINGISWKSNR